MNLLDYIIDRAYEIGMMIILNPSPYNEMLEKCDYDKVSMFLVNEVEGERITKENDRDKILHKLRELYPEAKVVLTLGGRGSVYQDKNQSIIQNIYKVPVVDTTAAGDAFLGGFVHYYEKSGDISASINYGQRVSAYAIQRVGAQQSLPSGKDMKMD